jgi:ADP-heptose:LPS heptosyltransferase
VAVAATTQKAGSHTALVLLLPGLGDAFAAGPILRGLSRDGWTVDAVTMHPPVSEYLRALGVVRDVVELPLRPRAAEVLRSLALLRRRGYETCFLPFPATRWQYAAIARGAGAKRLVMHEYGGSASAIARTSGNTRVPLRGGHRLAENLRLARAAGLPADPAELVYWIPAAWKSERLPGTVGLHPGSMAYKGNEVKRWPYERFVALARAQAARGRSVRFFLGPHEIAEARQAEEDFRESEGISIIREPLTEAARRLSECEVFVGNDAGFSHLASGLGVKTLALYGMTSEIRGAPIGPAVAFRPSLCPACHDEGLRGFECVRRLEYRCILKDIEPTEVLERVEALFAGPPVAQPVVLEGPFRLYGKAYG